MKSVCAHKSYLRNVKQSSDASVSVTGVCVSGVAREYLSDAQLSVTQRPSSVSYVPGFACLCQCVCKIRQCVNHPQLAVRCVGVGEGKMRSRVGHCSIRLLFSFCISDCYVIIFPLTVFWIKSMRFHHWHPCLPPFSPMFLILSVPISQLVLSLWSGWGKHACGLRFEVWQTYRHCSVISPGFTTAEEVLNASLQGADGLRLSRPTNRERKYRQHWSCSLSLLKHSLFGKKPKRKIQ